MATKNNNNPKIEEMETPEEFALIDQALSEKENLARVEFKDVDSSTSRKSKYVFIRHNSSDNYKDISKPAEHGVDLYPGGFARDMSLAAIQKGNQIKYLTGLDEDLYKEDWEKEYLKESLKLLEKDFTAVVNDPFNMDFWKTRRLIVQDDETILDLTDSDDLLTYWNIKGGGYPFIAKSPDELDMKNSRFYLEEPHLSYKVDDDGGRAKDKAVQILSELDEGPNSFSNLFFLHKNLITSQEGITYNTPKKLVYSALRKFIEGDYNKTRKKLAPKQFIDAVNMLKTNSKKARASAIVRDCIFYGILSTNRDNQWINNETGFNFKTTEESKVIDMLMTPTHNDELISLLNAIQKNWNKY